MLRRGRSPSRSPSPGGRRRSSSPLPAGRRRSRRSATPDYWQRVKESVYRGSPAAQTATLTGEATLWWCGGSPVSLTPSEVDQVERAFPRQGWERLRRCFQHGVWPYESRRRKPPVQLQKLPRTAALVAQAFAVMDIDGSCALTSWELENYIQRAGLAPHQRERALEVYLQGGGGSAHGRISFKRFLQLTASGAAAAAAEHIDCPVRVMICRLCLIGEERAATRQFEDASADAFISATSYLCTALAVGCLLGGCLSLLRAAAAWGVGRASAAWAQLLLAGTLLALASWIPRRRQRWGVVQRGRCSAPDWEARLTAMCLANLLAPLGLLYFVLFELLPARCR
jgi:hypothetical protein